MIWNKSTEHKILNSNRNDVDIVQVSCNLRKFVKAFKNLLFKYVITKKKVVEKCNSCRTHFFFAFDPKEI
jgi:hypothetical protein